MFYVNEKQTENFKSLPCIHRLLFQNIMNKSLNGSRPMLKYKLQDSYSFPLFYVGQLILWHDDQKPLAKFAIKLPTRKERSASSAVITRIYPFYLKISFKR